MYLMAAANSSSRKEVVVAMVVAVLVLVGESGEGALWRVVLSAVLWEECGELHNAKGLLRLCFRTALHLLRLM